MRIVDAVDCRKAGLPRELARQPAPNPASKKVAQAVRQDAIHPLWHRDAKPAIGLVLCKTRDRVIAEYALRDISKPIGVAEWQTKLVHSLPEPLKSNLPTIEEIEEELGGGQ